MALVLAIPLAELAIAILQAGLLTAGTLVVLTSADEVLRNTKLPAKARQWVSEHARQFEADGKKEEDREPTPATCPPMFEWKTIEGEKAAESLATGELWTVDHLHGDHFEVYSSIRFLKKGERNRAVYLDGRRKIMF